MDARCFTMTDEEIWEEIDSVNRQMRAIAVRARGRAFIWIVQTCIMATATVLASSNGPLMAYCLVFAAAAALLGAREQRLAQDMDAAADIV